MASTPPGPRFGVWTLVNGSWASRHHPEDPPDASWQRNRRQILLAEELGYDSTLVAQHTIHPSGDDLDQLEAWSASAALAALTERIENPQIGPRHVRVPTELRIRESTAALRPSPGTARRARVSASG